MGISSMLGLIGGSAFLWAGPDRAWDVFMAGFLWTLLVAVGSGLFRCFTERLRRGEWKRGIAIGCEMSFPLTTLYMVAAALITALISEDYVLHNGTVVTSKPDMLLVAPLFYACTLVVAIVIGPVYVLTSPFKKK